MALFRYTPALLKRIDSKKNEPSYSDRDPRRNASIAAAANKTNRVKYMLPICLVAVIGSIIYVVLESQKQKENNAVCVNCDRQKQIVQEIYFNKRIKD